MSHWYTPQGEARHFINGRATTLRDARKENLLPSVTTILGILDKPALTNWKLKQVTEACWDCGDWEEDYNAYHKEMLNRALGPDVTGVDRGGEIHDCNETIFLGHGIAHFPLDIQEIALEATGEICGYTATDPQDFSPEQIVIGNGYGGKVDLHNDDFVIDWKTKSIDDINKKMAYPEHAMQLAAYAVALAGLTLKGSFGVNKDGFWMEEGTKWIVDRRCINVFIDRTEPGKVVIHEWKPEEIELAWKKFKLLVEYWQLDKNYFPEAS